MGDILKEKFIGLDLESIKSPNSVAFDVTSKCNFRCRHCYNNSGNDIFEELSDEELLRIANEIADMQPTGVCLCGGEPLLRGNVIYEIINILSQKCGIVNMVSNGWIISEEICRKLKQNGLHVLQISLDGFTEFQHENMRMKAGAFSKAKEAIKVASKCELRTVVSFCPNILNYKYFPEVAQLAFELGAKEIRSMPLILMGRGKCMEKLQLSSTQYLEYQQIIQDTKKKYQNVDFKVDWGDPLDHLTRLPNNEKLGMNSFSVEIRADGCILLSSYLPIVVGDLKKHSLKEYWNGGLNKLWTNPIFLKYYDNIYSTTQFGDYNPPAYCGNDIVIDLLEGGKVNEV